MIASYCIFGVLFTAAMGGINTIILFFLLMKFYLLINKDTLDIIFTIMYELDFYN